MWNNSSLIIKRPTGTQFLKGTICFVLLAIIILFRLQICTNYSLELVNGETNNIWNAIKVASGSKIYTDPETAPYEIFQYTPLSQIPLIGVAKLVMNSGAQVNYVLILMFGRLLSLLYNLISAFMIFKILRSQLGVLKVNAILGAIISFALIPHHLYAIRPDSMSVMFILIGTYLFGQAYLLRKQNLLIFSGLIFGISFFVKQDAILFSSGLGLLLLINRNFKGLIIFVLAILATVGVLLLLSPFIFGPYFFKSVFGGIALEAKFSQFSYIFLRTNKFYFLSVIAVIASIVLIFKGWREKPKKSLYIITISLTSLLIAMGTSFKVGAHMNYYAPTLFFASIIISFAVFERLSKFSLRTGFLINSILTFLIVFQFLYLQIFHYTSPFLKNKFLKELHYEYLTNNFSTIEEIKETELSVCSFEPKSRILLHEQINMPNLEFYPVSKFSYATFNNNNPDMTLHFIILPNQSNFGIGSLTKFNIKFDEYGLWKETEDLSIYKHGH